MTGLLLPASEDGPNADTVEARPSFQRVAYPRPGPRRTHSGSEAGDSDEVADSDSVWDLGPPGFEATLDIFKSTSDEKTIYLGPWEIVETEPRRIVWQCSYQNERLEHFLPTNDADGSEVTDTQSVFPFTFHGKHTQFNRPLEGEQAVTFQAHHRLRYTSSRGDVVFDQYMKPIYRFMAIESSLRFQSDLRQKVLVDCFDADVVWTDVYRRENAFGGAAGIAAIQRIKLWRDARTGLHSLSVFASRWDRQHKEFSVRRFESELRTEDKRKRAMLVVKKTHESAHPPSHFPIVNTAFFRHVFGSPARRGTAVALQQLSAVQPSSRRLSISSNLSSASSFSGSYTSSRTSISSRAASLTDPEETMDSTEASLGIQYLSIEFTLNRDYRRFVKTWTRIHAIDTNAHVPPHFMPHTHDVPLGAPSPALLSLSTGNTVPSEGLAIATIPTLSGDSGP